MFPLLPTLAQPPKVYSYGKEVIVTYRDVKFLVEDQVAIFKGGVTVTFGPTQVEAETVTLFMGEDFKFGRAEGGATLTDPDGTITAKSLSFNWKRRTAYIEDAHLRTLGLTVNAKTIRVEPETWKLTGVDFTTCSRPLPFYEIGADSIIVQPGSKATLYRAYYKLLGKKLGTLPKQSFSLDQRQTGFKAPLPTYRRDLGVGFRSDGVILTGNNTAISGVISSFKRALPSYNLYFNKSFIPVGRSQGYIASRSGLQERVPDSYFVNIGIPTPVVERELAERPRNLLGFGTSVNENALGRDRADAFYTKMFEATYEKSSKLKKVAVNGKLRVNQIRRFSGTEFGRVEFDGFALGPSLKLSDQTSATFRVDGGLLGGANQMGWGIATAGVSTNPTSFLRLSAAYALGGQTGQALFPIDNVLQSHQVILRGDLVTGPTKLSLIHKYDPKNRHWFDMEYQFTQVIGCLEGLVRYRGFVGDYRIGLSLRLDAVAEALTKREVERPFVMTEKDK